VAKNIHPGQAVEFTLSGEGQMPRDAQNSAMGQQVPSGMGDAASTDTGNKPGGGIGNPIDTPDPLTKYKWWMLGALALLLVAAAGFILRKQGALATGGPSATLSDTAFENRATPSASTPSTSAATSYAAAPANYATMPPGNKAALLNILKEELFAIESEKLSGTISAAEYAEVKVGLEAVLKRALKGR
jgi:hypothetical protein